MVVLCKSLYALCIACGAVYHTGRGIRIMIFLYCVIPTCDNITGHEVRLAFVRGIAVMPVPRAPSLRIY